MSDRNRAAVQRLFDEFYNKGNLDVADDLMAPQVVIHDAGAPPQAGSPQLAKERHHAQLIGMPDSLMTLHEVVAEGHLAAYRWTASGTHTGLFRGIPPTGRPMAMSGISVVRFEQGKMAEVWHNYDALGMLQQLGIIPARVRPRGRRGRRGKAWSRRDRRSTIWCCAPASASARPRDSGGARWENEFFIAPGGGKEPSQHVHRTSKERFEIVRGSAHYLLDGVERPAAAGDVIDFPPGVPHLHPWNVGTDELHTRQVVEFPTPNQPALIAMETFFETIYGLARDGKVNRQGLPNPLQMAVLARSIQPEFWLAGIPFPMQRILFGALAGLGRILGYRAADLRYSRAG